MGLWLGILFLFLLIEALLLGAGIGIGFLLHRLLPAVDLGVGILIGVVTTGFAVYFYGRLLAALQAHEDQQAIEELEQEIIPRIFTMGPLPSERKRKRRPPR